MQGQKKPFDTEVAPLLAANLQSIPAATHPDKARFIHDFIESQRQYLARYTSEGRTVITAWDRDSPAVGGTPTRKNTSREILASAFDTPILKPRVPLALDVESVVPSHGEIEASAGCAKTSRSKTRRSKTSETPEQVIWSQSQKENVPKAGSKRRSEHRGHAEIDKAVPGTVNKQLTLDRYATKAEAKSKRTSKKRQHSPDASDPEHSTRLAERRERRRTKRAIVAPKGLVAALSDGESDSTSGRREVTKGKRKKKSTSLAAGLALMHGFTAKNIGKNRLTTQPEQRNGVFVKGKASANVPVAPFKTKRDVLSKGFSESDFLNKTKRSPRPRGNAFDETSDSSSRHPSSGSDVDLEEPVQGRLKHRSSEKAQQSKTNHLPSEINESGLVEVEQQSGTSIAQTKKGTTRSASIVWDIEMDGKSLPSGDSECNSADKAEAGTVVLNTQSKKWSETLANPAMRSTSMIEGGQKEEQVKNLDATVDRSSAVSLRPSESASQLPRYPLSAAIQPSVSRFFAPLPVTPLERAHVNALCAVEGETGPPSSPLQSTVRFNSPPIEDSMEQCCQPLSQLSNAPEVVESLSSNAVPRAAVRTSPASITMSALDQELWALDDGDYGLLYAARRQESSTQYVCEQDVQLSVLLESRVSAQDTRQLSDGSMDLFDNAGLIPELSELAFTAPEVHRWCGQQERMNWQEQYLDHATVDADSGASWHADLFDGEVQFEGWNDAVGIDETAMVLGSQIGSEDALSYVDGEVAEDELCFSLSSDELPDGGHCGRALRGQMTNWREFYEGGGEEQNSDVPLRPQTASSWCSVASEPPMSYSPSAIASEVSTVASLVPKFDQGRDLLLGLSEQSDNRNPYSIANIEEDVARSLRGHWLPQRL
ncbi:uncharacterized protein C8Q71DRAFT_865883 [Rhodofomes roseus]|uniref:Inner centromere protein ARK-binding domain-containing protein n=1 Tax=Rhodofomes roseus TaxID=34475 RepID=A0ABQ8KZE5_9APHY|nr:uncharacterized protein C8Q71DRAFT_865883 [Rhodofomes roseus]KAH9844071.1 hypothetical protein C8Q71DRAFT_865883 [Rhodofomes roseus]